MLFISFHNLWLLLKKGIVKEVYNFFGILGIISVAVYNILKNK